MKINQANQSRLEALKRIRCIVCGDEGHIVYPTGTESPSECFIVCNHHDDPDRYKEFTFITNDYLEILKQIS